MTKKKREYFTSKQKISFLKELLVDRKSMSLLGEDNGPRPRSLYQWRDQLFNEGHVIFDRKNDKETGTGAVKKLNDQVKQLESEVSKKNEIISELMGEFIKQKKLNGEI